MRLGRLPHTDRYNRLLDTTGSEANRSRSLPKFGTRGSELGLMGYPLAKGDCAEGAGMVLPVAKGSAPDVELLLSGHAGSMLPSGSYLARGSRLLPQHPCL